MNQPKAVLLAITAHTELGDTGRPTGFNVKEAAEPWSRFRDAGYRVDFVAPSAATPRPDGADTGDPVQKAFLDQAASQTAAPLRPEDIEPSRYAAVFYVGGHGTMWDFPNDADLARVASSVYADGGVVAAVCHGPAGLIGVTDPDGRPLVEGKRLTAFTDSEEAAVGLADTVPFLLAAKLVELGAKHSGAPDWEANVVTDGRLVTGQNPASAAGTAEAALAVLRS